MGLHWGAPVLESLIPSLWAQIQSVHVDPHTPIIPNTLNFVNGATGEKMGAGVTLPKWYRLQRSKLRDLLATDIAIQYGRRLESISYKSVDGQDTVTATFSDGTTAQGRILIGADGAKSTVRRLLLPNLQMADVKRLPYAATFVQARYTREQALFLRSFHPLYLASPHPKGLFAFFAMHDAPDPNTPESWTFLFYISWPTTIEQQDEEAKTLSNADRLKQLQALAVDFVEPWKSAAAWLSDGQPCFHSSITVWDPSLETSHWSNHGGRVTLAGDAAHPMTFRKSLSRLYSIPRTPSQAPFQTQAIQSTNTSQSEDKASTTPSPTAAISSKLSRHLYHLTLHLPPVQPQPPSQRCKKQRSLPTRRK